MSDIAEIVLSFFGLIGIGYAAIRTRLLAGNAGAGLSGLAFTIAVPVLLFRTLATADLKGVAPWGCGLPISAASRRSGRSPTS